MTEWTTRPARHIPEEELHAYLDQALSRSQCAEIETHLSSCRACQAERASVAALRDRTTALLSGLAPRPLIVPPSYVSLRERHSRRLTLALWRARVRRSALWAAAVVAAVGSGWIARTVMDPHHPAPVSVPLAQTSSPSPSPTATVPAVASEPTGSVSDVTAELERQAIPIPVPDKIRPFAPKTSAAASQRATTQAAIIPAPTLHLASASIPIRSPVVTGGNGDAQPATGPFNRIWRAVPWEEALQIAGSGLPYIEGLTVVGVLFQPGVPGERPTVIVAQQDQSGEIIQSIEGPAARVTELVQRQGSQVHASEPARTPPDYLEGSAGIRRAQRTLVVTGRLPVDSLNALARVAAIR